MDFEGQRLSEQLVLWVTGAFTAAGFVAGYCLQSLGLALAVFAAGVGVAFTVAVPEWSYFKQHPLVWLDPLSDTLAKPGQGKGPKTE